MAKTIFITGASSGIGEHVALEMAQRGYNLALTARRLERLEDLKGRITAAHPNCVVELAQLDVTDTDATVACVNALWERCGGFDIALANAGIGADGPAGTGVLDRQLEMIDTNIRGFVATIDAVTAKMVARGTGGQIVGIASVAAYRGMAGSGVYSGSKAFVVTYMDALRLQLRGAGIDVSILSPGFIDTAINEDLGDKRMFLVDVKTGAKAAADLIERKVKHKTVPVMPWTVMGWLMKRLPDAMMPNPMGDR